MCFNLFSCSLSASAGVGRQDQTMSSPPEAAKRDRLSALPDDILHRIMRFMYNGEPVTVLSLLSQRWRHLWASSPYFIIQCWSMKNSKNFGTMLLLLRDAVPLHTFSMSTIDDTAFGHYRGWVRYAVSCGLRVPSSCRTASSPAQHSRRLMCMLEKRVFLHQSQFASRA